MHNATWQRAICSSGVNSAIAQAWNSFPAPKRGRKEFRPDELVLTEACAPLNGGQAWPQTRESLSWVRMTRSARQDAKRSGKEDAGHSLFLGGCLFGFYGKHHSKIRKGSYREVTWRGLVVTWRLIRDWSYLLTFRMRFLFGNFFDSGTKIFLFSRASTPDPRVTSCILIFM